MVGVQNRSHVLMIDFTPFPCSLSVDMPPSVVSVLVTVLESLEIFKGLKA